MLGTLLVSLGLLFAVGFSTMQLAKGMEVLAASAAVLLHSLFSVVAVAVLLIAKGRQGTIGGSVTIEGRPVQFATVTLYGFEGTERRKVDSLPALSENGRFLFRVWLSKEGGEFQVEARQHIGPPVRSEKFPLKRGEQLEVLPPLKLQLAVSEMASSEMSSRVEAAARVTG